MGRRTIFLCFLFLLLSRTLLAQNISISGKILSLNSKIPLPYVEISIKDQNIGTITNKEGRFALDANTHGADSLVISHVSYQTKTIGFSDLTNKELTIFLTPKTILLGEVTAHSRGIIDIVNEALFKTRSLLKLPMRFEAYYREFVKENGNYTKFSDGILEYDVFGSVDKLRSRVLPVQTRAKLVLTENEGKIDWDLTSPLDVRKAINPFILKKLQEIVEDSDQYNLKMDTHVQQSGDDLIEIKFIPKPDTKECLYYSSVLIDTTNKHILSCSYELEQNEEKDRKEINLLILKAEIREHTAMVKFKQVGSSLLPFYKNERVEMRMWNKKKINETFLFMSDLMITKNIAGYSPIPKKDSYKKKALYPLGNNYETTFWEGQNTIRLTAEEERIIEQLK